MTADLSAGVHPSPGRWGRPLGRCGGYQPKGCWDGAYANDDIFFLEACAYAMSCANADELFRVRAREPFHCRVSERGVRRLQHYLTSGEPPP